MKARIEISGNQFYVDLSKPIDISIPLEHEGKLTCFHAPTPKFEPVIAGDFIGSVAKGSPVNFYNVMINPHGNGTHTECQGHITAKQESIKDCLNQFHFLAQLVSVTPDQIGEDLVITKAMLENIMGQHSPSALIIRTLPNTDNKLTANYSDTNPTYITQDAMHYIVNRGIEHLLIDLPSVDRERDEGALAAHHIFWNAPVFDRSHCTISEMIYVPDSVKDGLYILNLQCLNIALDASPSRPVLYGLE